MEQRISWAWTYAYHKVWPALLVSLFGAFGLWWVWTSVRTNDWFQAAAGVIVAVLSCWELQRIRGLHEVWLRDGVLILRRGRTRHEVPLDRVTSLDVSLRAQFARNVSLYWMDDAGVERRVRFAVTDSPAWIALLQRLTNRVPPVRIFS